MHYTQYIRLPPIYIAGKRSGDVWASQRNRYRSFSCANVDLHCSSSRTFCIFQFILKETSPNALHTIYTITPNIHKITPITILEFFLVIILQPVTGEKAGSCGLLQDVYLVHGSRCHLPVSILTIRKISVSFSSHQGSKGHMIFRISHYSLLEIGITYFKSNKKDRL